VTGLISKHFIWTESAGRAACTSGIASRTPRRSTPGRGSRHHQRYGMKPQIDFYEVFAVTDNTCGRVELFKETLPPNDSDKISRSSAALGRRGGGCTGGRHAESFAPS